VKSAEAHSCLAYSSPGTSFIVRTDDLTSCVCYAKTQHQPEQFRPDLTSKWANDFDVSSLELHFGAGNSRFCLAVSFTSIERWDAT